MYDGHVHSRWSWDTGPEATLDALCQAAAAAGIDAITVADHLDVEADGWCRSRGRIRNSRRGGNFSFDARLAESPSSSDVAVDLGLEVGEPHLFGPEIADHVDQATTVLASVHSIVVDGDLRYVDEVLPYAGREEVLASYFDEVERMVDETQRLDVVTHINFPFRFIPYENVWPRFEGRYRRVFRAIAARGVAVEINARTPSLTAEQLDWAAAEGVTRFIVGSDAHTPDAVGHGVRAAAEDLERAGFRCLDGRTYKPS